MKLEFKPWREDYILPSLFRRRASSLFRRLLVDAVSPSILIACTSTSSGKNGAGSSTASTISTIYKAVWWWRHDRLAYIKHDRSISIHWS